MDINKIEGYYQNAIKYAQLGEYEIAYDMINKIHELIPNNDEIYHASSAIRMQAEDYEGCIIDSERCVEINPNNASGWNHLGVALCCSGQIPLGLTKLKRAIDLGFQDAITNYNYWQKK